MRCGWIKKELGTTSSKGDTRLATGLCDSVAIQGALLAWLGLNGSVPGPKPRVQRNKALLCGQVSSEILPGAPGATSVRGGIVSLLETNPRHKSTQHR